MARTVESTELFEALRGILRRHAGGLSVSEDSSTCYCLAGGMHPKHKRPIPIAWVRVGTGSVSFDHMGVYACPATLRGVSKELRSRMQGKSCFNFRKVDHTLFSELETVTA